LSCEGHSSSGRTRAELLSIKAREIAPKAPAPAYVYMYWLKSVGRCPEVVELGHQFIRMGPDQAHGMLGIYSQLGQCLTQTGHAEEDITLQGKAIESDPSNPWMFWRYMRIPTKSAGDSGLMSATHSD
jgi:hypothetical protein